jgi:hypothetical protein
MKLTPVNSFEYLIQIQLEMIIYCVIMKYLKEPKIKKKLNKIGLI